MMIADSVVLWARRGFAGLMLLLLGAQALAQGDVADPPGRIGRLSDLQGQVWLYTPDGGEWTSAERNRPVTTGDRLATDAGARAELRIGSMTLRLDGGTEIEALRIDDDRVELQLHNGSLAARLGSRDIVREFGLRTGEGSFRAQRTGRYRFDRRDETSHLTVYGGEAAYEGPNSALTVYSGQHAEFWLDSANAAQYSVTEPVRDEFAAWTSERDRADDRNASARYVSPEMTGAEDLDRYGRWQQDDENGAVWIPHGVAPGWAPYSAGHWSWVSPWGWTWIDDAPWGFAPFHYGRWVWLRNTWCWAPGRRVSRPVYAPALVGWVGGPQVSVAVSIGTGPLVGWFPLAPREVYVPAYRVSPRYVRDVNITHVTNITNVTNIITPAQRPSGDSRGSLINNAPQDRGHPEFRNRRIPGAVTVVPTSVLTGRQPVAPAAAEMVKAPAVRELVAAPSRGIPLVAPPVAAPVSAAREVRQVTPQPPGVARPGPRVPQDRAAPSTSRGDERDSDLRIRPRPPVERVEPPPPRVDVPVQPPGGPERRSRESGDGVRSAPPQPQVQPLARPRVAPPTQPAPEAVPALPPQARRPDRRFEPEPVARPRELRPPAVQMPDMPRAAAPAPRAVEARPPAREDRAAERRDDRREREWPPKSRDR